MFFVLYIFKPQLSVHIVDLPTSTGSLYSQGIGAQANLSNVNIREVQANSTPAVPSTM